MATTYCVDFYGETNRAKRICPATRRFTMKVDEQYEDVRGVLASAVAKRARCSTAAVRFDCTNYSNGKLSSTTYEVTLLGALRQGSRGVLGRMWCVVYRMEGVK